MAVIYLSEILCKFYVCVLCGHSFFLSHLFTHSNKGEVSLYLKEWGFSDRDIVDRLIEDNMICNGE